MAKLADHVKILGDIITVNVSQSSELKTYTVTYMQKVLRSYSRHYGLPAANTRQKKNNRAPTAITPFEWHNDWRIIVVK